MSEEAPVGSPLDGRFSSMQPRSDGNVYILSRDPDRDLGIGWATSTSLREEAYGGADMTWYGIPTRDQDQIRYQEVDTGRLPVAAR